MRLVLPGGWRVLLILAGCFFDGTAPSKIPVQRWLSRLLGGCLGAAGPGGVGWTVCPGGLAVGLVGPEVEMAGLSTLALLGKYWLMLACPVSPRVRGRGERGTPG